MHSICLRRIRVLVEGDVEWSMSALDDTASFDYTNLLHRRPALHRPVARTTTRSFSGDADGDIHDEGVAAPASDGLESAYSLETSVASYNTSSSSSDDALGLRVGRAADMLVSRVFATQQRVLQLVGSLAREIAGFAGDPAIAAADNWDVCMELDRQTFPHTTLYLTLSPFLMKLRFDAQDLETKQILLDHSVMLERELDAVLRAWGYSREIQLTIW